MEITDKLRVEIANLEKTKGNNSKLKTLKELQVLMKGVESYGINDSRATDYINQAMNTAKDLLENEEDPEWFYQLCVLTKDNSGIDFLEKEANKSAGFSSKLYHRFYDAAKKLAGKLGDLKRGRELYICQKFI